MSICLLSKLQYLYVNNNPGVLCSPMCLSSIPSGSNIDVSAAVCVFAQDNGLCGLIAATNIESISGYSQWSCSTAGYTTTTPCLSPVWPGLGCVGINVVSISVNNVGLTGNFILDISINALFCCNLGTISSSLGFVTPLSYLKLSLNSLNGICFNCYKYFI